jgi:hypothetical protein
MVMARAFKELDNQVKLEKASDPDRMKGALHVMWNKSVGMWNLFESKILATDLKHSELGEFYHIVPERPH